MTETAISTQVFDRGVPLFRGNPIDNAAARSALIEAEDQAGLFRRAAMDE